ncbi:MAG: Asp-tRNA(Asn)/Glu-tRNA(Gln) amidotransferase subunit GatC [Micrococcales bacterium]|nr:Asp-tRNA(Asn)/Glu-tRNA(Gln) amidotransferase subunit GatC [Micrococcales bacterium]
MSTISTEEVARIAALARIDLPADELKQLAPQLAIITEAVTKVIEVAGSDVPATSHPIAMVNVTRPDEPWPSLGLDQVFQGAPEREADQFKVPRILGEEP